MNLLEKKMLNSLIELRENYNVIGIKAEFEAEGTRTEEALRLKEIVTKADLDLTIKIGGCEAVKDMFEAKTIGCCGIVGPMIETPYAMQKYVKTVNFVFPPEEQIDMKFFINVETLTGFQNLDDMIASDDFASIDGIVFGRVDMTGSMGLDRNAINSEPLFEMADKMSLKMRALGKQMIVGGGVGAEALPFFRRMRGGIDKYETRKVIFDAKKSLNSSNAEDGLIKAVGFELMWLKNKRDFYGAIYKEDALRIEMLEKRYEKLLHKVTCA